ncbi:colicin immunity domain-containing protein [Streptomyces sp. NPDC017979]|uniref:colicin immunity domain-containing protein n=1 Tax=Streptomyces sp. NPDC017979 TaxID=3365024 RepID=UPI0037A60776
MDEVMAQLADFAPPGLLATSDLNGAVLFLSQGYALVAGTPLFLRSAVPEGVDGGRARFARYAHRVKERWPELSAVTQALPPRHTAWSHVQDIPPGTGTARQVELMRGLVGGECSAADFARGWLDARRVSLSNGERLQRSLSLVLDEVFALLENYAIDPSLKEPGDLSDDELKREVRRLMQRATGWLE